MTNHCPHISIVGNYTEDQVLSKSACDTCQESALNLWVCLHYDCLYVGCDENRSNHHTHHYKENPNHCLVLNLSTLRLWCYECQCEVYSRLHHLYYNKRYRQPNVTLGINDRNSDDNICDEDHNLKPKGLTGLQNLGNSCYMNAAIQALSNCPPMTSFFLDCHAFVKSNKKPALARSYCKLVSEIWHNQRPSYVNPQPIATGIRAVFPAFRGYNQQDSQEFLRCFMDQLHEEMKEPVTTEHFKRIDNCTSMDIDLSPDGPDSTDESVSDTEYETCESGRSSEKSSCSEKIGLMGNSKDENIVSSSMGNNKLNTIYNNRGVGGSRQQVMARSETPPPPLHGLDLDNSYDAPQMHNADCDGSDATSDQSAVACSTAPLLSRPSSSLSSIHDKSIPFTGHLLKGLSASSPQLKAQTVPLTNNYHRYQSSVNSDIVQRVRKKKQVKYRSVVSDVFDGKLLSSVQCLTCDRVSSTKETFQDLSLPIPSRENLSVLHASQNSVQKASLSTCTDVYSNQGWISWMFGWVKSWFWGPTVSLQDCLAAFFSADELKGDNMYSCEKCKKLRNGIKYSKVLSLPEILCIHLKRFRHEVLYSSKINNYVSFPLEGLDMQPFLHKDCSSTMLSYDLVAVICHHGTAHGGHYITYALNSENDQWYEFDDQCVTEVDPQTVANCEAYVLFYRKSTEEMNKKRTRAVELMEISKHEPGLMHFYVSKQWVNKFNSFAEPGPINNYDFLCHHGAVQPSKFPYIRDLTTVLSQGVWEYLHDTYGGGPPCTNVYSCPTCLSEKQALEERKTHELSTFLQFRRDQAAQIAGAICTCAISLSWFKRWEFFVKGKEEESPGPIDNSGIASTKNGHIVLKIGSDYAPVSESVWKFLHGIYGGGPYLSLRSMSSPGLLNSENHAQNSSIMPNHSSPTNNVHSTTQTLDESETIHFEMEGKGDPEHTLEN